MKYVNLTPRWIEIARTWRMIVENCNSCKRGCRDSYNLTMSNFWDQFDRACQGADNYADLVAVMRKELRYSDDDIEHMLEIGRKINERERNTIKETDDVVS